MADPLRRTLSKLRGKKSKRGKVAEGTSTAPEEDAQMPSQHPLANQNNNNYREVLWAGEDCRWTCGANMTREHFCKPGGDNCPCTACQGAVHKPQRPGWAVDGWGTQTAAGQGCEYSGFMGYGRAVAHEDLGVTKAPHTYDTLSPTALSPAPGHAQLCSHSKVATYQTLPVDSAQCPDQAFQEGKLLLSRQNGFIRAQNCPQQQWQQARDIVSELATAHPGQARHFYASLQQSYRSSQHSLDSEDDDYYDNDCLPFYEPPELSGVQGGQDPPPARNGDPAGKGSAGVSQETDRLRSQLQEAYYLLIHAMHDLPVERRSPLPSSTPSQDSICTQSSPRAHCSSGEASPQQASDSESAAPASGALPPRRHHWSKSEETLGREGALPPLHRSLSDSGIQYGPLPPRPRDRQECGGGPDSEEEDSQCPAAEEQAVRWGRAASGAGHPSRADKEWLGGLGDPDHSPSGMGSRPDGPLRASGVTVRKMQKWMYKGRLLSLEMKERIIGGALRPGGLSPRDEGRGGGMVPGSAPSNRRQRTGPGIKASILEFSPPSSPSPVKKGGPINWSFPDKIKSPRTVRKLSMKMKKLPELSRKLSVKGGSSHNNYDNSSSSPKGYCQGSKHPSSLASGNTAAASRNVISRYHLDSSVSSQHNYKKKTTGNSKSSSKGGYLSDGDSPELLTKSGKHASENRANKGKEALQSNNNKTDIDIDAFRHYNFSDQPKCSHYISGLMSVHFYGAEDLKPPRIDTKDVFCAIQVDSVNKARTALLTCRTAFLEMDHTFNIDLENAQYLKLVVFSWDPAPRKNRVCCHGTVVLPSLFRVTKMHQLAVKLEPRGLIYVKITLMDQRENSFNSSGVNREPVMFGVDARKVVEMENVGLMVPLLMEKCIVEIEKRGCQVVGLYRLCGSAAVKKELREAFERDSKNLVLCENQYPDINVITGVLKDYLRELPSPLITKQLYEAVLNAMARKPLKMTGNGNETDTNDLKNTVGLLDCLPDVEKATLKMLLDHLKRVASHHEVNKMTCQNLAVCFGPVLLSQRQETSHHNNRVFTDSEELASALDFKKHIEVLHYLLQMWPVQTSTAKESMYTSTSPEQQPYLRRKKERPQVLNLNNSEMAGIRRPRPVRLDSPSSNRYAGDWSSCGENYFLNVKENLNEADYDDVPSEDIESGEDIIRTDKPENVTEDQISLPKEHPLKAFMAMQKIDSSLDPRVDLQDLQESIDNLIGNLERELNKNKLTISY
ncbi:rho GTPase-activating protein SYDE2 isoform X3 [Lissotriton helveticus]